MSGILKCSGTPPTRKGDNAILAEFDYACRQSETARIEKLYTRNLCCISQTHQHQARYFRMNEILDALQQQNLIQVESQTRLLEELSTLKSANEKIQLAISCTNEVLERVCCLILLTDLLIGFVKSRRNDAESPIGLSAFASRN